MGSYRLGARALTAAAFAGSGALAYAAAWQRWAGACPRGGFDTDPCLTLQDSRYDYQWPADPWVPIGNAAQLFGVSLIVLAVAAFSSTFLLASSRRRGMPCLLAALPTACYLGLGALVVAAGAAGRPVDAPLIGGISFVVAALLWPVALILYGSTAAGWFSTEEHRPPVGRPLSIVALGLLLLANTPWSTYVLGAMVAGYTSYDTTPWTEATGAALLVVAGIVSWPATSPPSPAPSRQTHDGPVVEEVDPGGGRGGR